ncbi:MAG TPA: GTP-binding protein [Pseudolabrys sp.]|nr:GTP-binding protein [Pseudolabrys sp.]
MCAACEGKAVPRIPVLLVTGYLGSGKTTLLNHLLGTRAFNRAAVVVNEFGEVSVDHVLVRAPKPRIRVVDSGCLCGHVHEEVATALLDLDHQRQAGCELDFDFVLIETSGLADPVPIIQILLTDAHVTAHFELRSVITVVDGLHGFAHLAREDESLKQAAVADTLVISKTDLATLADLERLSAKLSSLNRDARQLRIAHGKINPLQVLTQSGYALSARSEDAKRWLGDVGYATQTPAASDDPLIATFSLEHDGEITIPGLVLWLNCLAGFRGAGLLRVKGIVNVEGRPHAVQAVQTVVSEPVPLDAWPDDDRGSRLVFITRGMDPDDIRRTFAAFAFEGGRAPRNSVLNPQTYARFRDTIELFRSSPARTRTTIQHEKAAP